MKAQEGRMKRESDLQIQSFLEALSATHSFHPAKVTSIIGRRKKNGVGALCILSIQNTKKTKPWFLGGISPPLS